MGGILRGLAMGAQAFQEAKLREQARAEARQQQALENSLREQALGLQRQQMDQSAQQQEFYRQLADRQQTWNEGAADRALSALRQELDIKRQDSAAQATAGLQDIARMALGQVPAAPSPAPADFAAKKAMLSQPLPAPLSQPADQVAAVPAMPAMVSAPGQVPMTVEPSATVAPVAPSAAPVRAKVKKQGQAPLRSFGQPRLPDANEGQLRGALQNVAGFGVTVGPNGTTYQYRPATEAERVGVEGARLGNEAARKQLEDAAAFLPFKLKAADMSNQLAAVEVGLKQFALSQAPAEAERQKAELQRLYTALDAAKEEQPLRVQQLKAQIAYTLMQTAAIPARLEQDQMGLNLRASAMRGTSGGGRSSGGTSGGAATLTTAGAIGVKPPTLQQQRLMMEYLQGATNGVMERATKDLSSVSADELTALANEIASNAAGGIIPEQTADRLMSQIAPVFEALTVPFKGASGTAAVVPGLPKPDPAWKRLWERIRPQTAPAPAGRATGRYNSGG